ncbi:hypothetical protein DFJ74DRAFT_767121, partial [Hyaloraphidium curvatum]
SPPAAPHRPLSPDASSARNHAASFAAPFRRRARLRRGRIARGGTSCVSEHADLFHGELQRPRPSRRLGPRPRLLLRRPPPHPLPGLQRLLRRAVLQHHRVLGLPGAGVPGGDGREVRGRIHQRGAARVPGQRDDRDVGAQGRDLRAFGPAVPALGPLRLRGGKGRGDCLPRPGVHAAGGLHAQPQRKLQRCGARHLRARNVRRGQRGHDDHRGADHHDDFQARGSDEGGRGGGGGCGGAGGGPGGPL